MRVRTNDGSDGDAAKTDTKSVGTQKNDFVFPLVDSNSNANEEQIEVVN